MADDPKKLMTDLDSISVLLSQSGHGDRLASKELLYKASALLAKGLPLPQELATWISTGLTAIAKQSDSRSAFDLGKPRGRPSEHGDEFERMVANSIHYSPLGLHKAENSKGSVLGAYTQASEDFDISANTAEKFYKKHLEDILAEEEIRSEFNQDID